MSASSSAFLPVCDDLHAAHLRGAVGLDHAPAVCAVGKVPAAIVISGHPMCAAVVTMATALSHSGGGSR